MGRYLDEPIIRILDNIRFLVVGLKKHYSTRKKNNLKKYCSSILDDFMSFAWWNIYSTVVRCKKKQMNACGSISIRCHPLLPKEGILLPVCALYKVCWFKPCGTSANERTLRTLKNALFLKKKKFKRRMRVASISSI